MNIFVSNDHIFKIPTKTILNFINTKFNGYQFIGGMFYLAAGFSQMWKRVIRLLSSDTDRQAVLQLLLTRNSHALPGTGSNYTHTID